MFGEGTGAEVSARACDRGCALPGCTLPSSPVACIHDLQARDDLGGIAASAITSREVAAAPVYSSS